jgi:4-alpha-glucanotransferase
VIHREDTENRMQRSSGILLHPTSLPSRFGIGDIGGFAHQWVDFLHKHKQSVWQVCPLGPTGFGDSPFQALSSFGGNTLLISPSRMVEDGLLSQVDVDTYPHVSGHSVDYPLVIYEKDRLFRKAFARFSDTDEFLAFCAQEAYWLDDYALFQVLKEKHEGASWDVWKPAFRLRFPGVLEEVKAAERREVRYHKFLQYQFHLQWHALKKHASSLGVKIVGVLPYYISFDSADAWSMPDLFEYDEAGKPLRVAGVPPDFYTSTGQRWGNPIYRWDWLKQQGYEWWILRVKKSREFFDIVRLNHFCGFETFWAIPATNTTAENGQWVRGPGQDFFDVVKKELGDVAFVADDLGETTPAVRELRRNVGIPGTKVLQFAFDGAPDNPYLPANIERDSVVYTGTHDNDASLAWFKRLEPGVSARVCATLGCEPAEFLPSFLRAAFASRAKVCIVPFQDVLGLDTGSRLNTPGRHDGTWQWRYTMEMVDQNRLRDLEDLTAESGRAPVASEVPPATQIGVDAEPRL